MHYADSHQSLAVPSGCLQNKFESTSHSLKAHLPLIVYNHVASHTGSDGPRSDFSPQVQRSFQASPWQSKPQLPFGCWIIDFISATPITPPDDTSIPLRSMFINSLSPPFILHLVWNLSNHVIDGVVLVYSTELEHHMLWNLFIDGNPDGATKQGRTPLSLPPFTPC